MRHDADQRAILIFVEKMTVIIVAAPVAKMICINPRLSRARPEWQNPDGLRATGAWGS